MIYPIFELVLSFISRNHFICIYFINREFNCILVPFLSLKTPFYLKSSVHFICIFLHTYAYNSSIISLLMICSLYFFYIHKIKSINKYKHAYAP